MTVNDVVQTVQAVNADMSSKFDKESVGRAIGRIASGVYIVTVDNQNQRDGIMASWISQAAFEPPMLTCAVHKDRHLIEWMGIAKKFTVNVLSKSNTQAFKNFAKPYTEGIDRFEGLEVLPGTSAGPVIADCVAYIDCATKTMVEAGDHVIVVGEIIGGQVLNMELEPMVHLRKNGFQY